mgnify:CR=1 FL=1
MKSIRLYSLVRRFSVGYVSAVHLITSHQHIWWKPDSFHGASSVLYHRHPLISASVPTVQRPVHTCRNTTETSEESMVQTINPIQQPTTSNHFASNPAIDTISFELIAIA